MDLLFSLFTVGSHHQSMNFVPHVHACDHYCHHTTAAGPCKEKIEQGALRFGSITTGDRMISSWRHFPQCMTKV